MNKKQIGLAVCYDTKNFGSQLQVLATDYKIRELGYDTQIIRYKKKPSLELILQTIPRFFNPMFVQGKLATKKRMNELKRHPEILEKVVIRNKRFENFVEEHFSNLSKWYIGWRNLKKSSDDFDAFLCGSDQLWLPQNLGSHFYTLEFVSDNKPKLAYATSFGVSQIPWFQKSRTRRYLNRFTALSTREIKGSSIIKKLTGRDAQVVCDPTLLMNSKEWDQTIADKCLVKEPYVFCYFLGKNEQHRIIATDFAKQKGLKIITCPFLDNFVEVDINFGDQRMFDVDAADFVNLIRHAEYVLTDSFHGTVFSILNHKQFITFNRFGNEAGSRNSRIDSLCELLSLQNRRFSGNIYEQLEETIDYSNTDKLLANIRNSSYMYLKEALESI